MYTQVEKPKENNKQSSANTVFQKQSADVPTFQFVDNRPETVQMRSLQAMVNNSPLVQRITTIQTVVNNSPRITKQRKQLNSTPDTKAFEASTEHKTEDLMQRRVITTDPDIVFDRNIATAWKGGGAYADTPAVINGKVIPPSANKEGMIHEPRLAEVGGQWRTMPVDQHVGCRVEAPDAGPWTLPGLVGLEELDAFAKAGGAAIPERTKPESSHTYTLIVHGRPSDGQLHAAILTHELHHVDEHNDVIDAVLQPWDTQVTDQVSSANDPLNASVAYDQLGIAKAQDIADLIVKQMRSKGIAFHDTEEGKEPDIAEVILDEAGHVYNVYLTPHPA